MYIKELFVSGYKTLVDFNLENINSGLNIFVGENNVGKSNILKLLDFVFNENRKLNYHEIPRTLNDFIISNNEEIPYVEITFKDINKKFKENIKKDAGNKDEARLKVLLTEERKYRHFVNSNTYTINNSIHKLFPKYIYFGDLEEKNFDINSLSNLFSIKNETEKRDVETIANQFLRQISNQRITLNISLRDESKYEVSVIDGYGNSNLYENKSSGIKQLCYLSLLFGINLSTKTENIILGIEEPESNLHTKLQRRLFKYIKKFNKQLPIQTFITTHSPIFIDKYDSKGVFHVRRNQNYHTHILNNSYRNNWLKIRKDLGLSVNDSLFIGDFNLIVEGPTEKIILPKVIDLLYEEDEIKFNSEDVNIISAQSAGNIHYYSKIVSQLGLPTCVLVDNDGAGKDAVDKIIKDDELTNIEIFQLKREGFTKSEFEDLIPDEILVDSINEVYDSDITIDNLQSARVINKEDSEEKVILKFSHTFNKLDLKDVSLSKIELADANKKKINKDHLDLLKRVMKEINNFYLPFS